MVRVLVGLLLSALAIIVIQHMRLERSHARYAKMERDYATAYSDALEQARKIEAQANKDVDEISKRLEEKLDRVKQNNDRVVADLTSGNIRLRKEWAGCETQRLSDAALASSLPDETDERRKEAAGDIVRVGAECDAREGAYIELLKLYSREH